MAEQLAGYEMMVIFKPLLPDDVRKGAHTSIVDIVKKYDGEVLGADVWGKRYLSYPIQSHEEGYYIVYEIKLPGKSIAEFEVEVRRISEVLRFLVSKNEHPGVASKKLNKKVIDI
jgi:small subunit ribosomal protein S6